MKSRVRRLALVVLSVGAIATIATIALPAVGLFLVVADPLRPSDAIFVLDGSTPARELAAGTLYIQHMAPVVVLTLARDPIGEIPRRLAGERPPQERAAAVLRHVGVPESAILRQTRRVDNTEEELRTDLDLARRRGFTRVILVTSPAHTRRVRTIFRSKSRGRVEGIVYPTPWERYAATRWWQSRQNLETTIHELGGLLNFELGSPVKTFDRGAP